MFPKQLKKLFTKWLKKEEEIRMKNRSKLISELRFLKANLLLILVFGGISAVLLSCGKEEVSEPAFTADFSYTFIDENNVRFTNASTGEYHIANWDFGNGETETTTNKNQQFKQYYREAGDYNVSLTIIGADGNRKSVSKTINISKTDFEVKFTYNIDASNPNYVNLQNASVGTYDSFKWLYRNKIIENEEKLAAYFPYAGKYEITLEINKGGIFFTSVQTVNITQDDPNYVSSFVLSWSDEFNGTTVNSANWTFETGASGWGNNELQNYTDGDNAKVENGKLSIFAKKVNENKTVGSYTSSRIITKGKHEFTYGRMEVRAKVPSGKGTWTAIWMLGSDYESIIWPRCGEIDIMEYVGHDPQRIHSTLHNTLNFGDKGNGSSQIVETAETEFHTYGLIWTEKEIKFYIDSQENITYTYSPSNKTEDNWPFYKPQFFILNIAIGGNWGGAQGIDNSIFPQTMEIDYIRVYQPNK